MELTLHKLSMLPVPPVLHNFPMVEVHPSVDIYAAFRPEPMHVLSLCVGRLLKECLVHMLSHDEESTNAMCKSNGDPKQFSPIRRTVLSKQTDFSDSLPNSLQC